MLFGSERLVEFEHRRIHFYKFLFFLFFGDLLHVEDDHFSKFGVESEHEFVEYSEGVEDEGFADVLFYVGGVGVD